MAAGAAGRLRWAAAGMVSAGSEEEMLSQVSTLAWPLLCSLLSCPCRTSHSCVWLRGCMPLTSALANEAPGSCSFAGCDEWLLARGVRSGSCCNRGAEPAAGSSMPSRPATSASSLELPLHGVVLSAAALLLLVVPAAAPAAGHGATCEIATSGTTCVATGRSPGRSRNSAADLSSVPARSQKGGSGGGRDERGHESRPRE